MCLRVLIITFKLGYVAYWSVLTKARIFYEVKVIGRSLWSDRENVAEMVAATSSFFSSWQLFLVCVHLLE